MARGDNRGLGDWPTLCKHRGPSSPEPSDSGGSSRWRVRGCSAGLQDKWACQLQVPALRGAWPGNSTWGWGHSPHRQYHVGTAWLTLTRGCSPRCHQMVPYLEMSTKQQPPCVAPNSGMGSPLSPLGGPPAPLGTFVTWAHLPSLAGVNLRAPHACPLVLPLTFPPSEVQILPACGGVVSPTHSPSISALETPGSCTDFGGCTVKCGRQGLTPHLIRHRPPYISQSQTGGVRGEGAACAGLGRSHCEICIAQDRGPGASSPLMSRFPSHWQGRGPGPRDRTSTYGCAGWVLWASAAIHHLFPKHTQDGLDGPRHVGHHLSDIRL